MGGSGGRYWGRPAIPLAELYERAREGTHQARYEAETEKILQDSLQEYNDRDVTAIHQHLETIEDALTQDIEGTVDMLFGGSIQKHTYVDGLSDVDMLVCLNESSLARMLPREVLAHFEQVLRQRLPRTEITTGDLSITVTFSDGQKIQLLPAVRTANGFRIAQPNENRWSNVVSPRRFAEKLTQVNHRLRGMVVPIIKLVKAMNDKLPKPIRLSGYHIESLAIEAFENYGGRETHQEMVRHFWMQAQNRVLRPISDSTGQSRHVDDYLGVTESQARQRVSNAIGKIVTNIETADNLRSPEKWEEMV